ncbi:SMI1/KNR4 family protein [Priestia abyssalis]|uniref:SMI1/KNR4 family protein n=1 Tax=Priestia abyssalis TaxID=1221450 RepID=UPI000995AFA5|nr:SMI1/KNR4 family protein [Priestia abyssalis]
MLYYNGMNFWDTNAEESSPSLTTLTIQEAEKELAVKLPQSYLKLLKEQNGVAPNYPYFFIDEERICMSYLNGIDFEGAERGIGILKSKEWTEEEGLPENLIVLWTDIHTWIVLDYRGRIEDPSVVYFYKDYSSAKDREWKSVEIAPNFDAFLNKLFRGSKLNPKKLKPSYGRKKE